VPDVLKGAEREAYEQRADRLVQEGVPLALAARVAELPLLLAVFDIVEVAAATGRDEETVMTVYFSLGSRLELNWLRDRIIELPRANRWQALARAALRDDLHNLHRSLTEEVLESALPGSDGDAAIEGWSERNEAAVQRTLSMLADIKASRAYDTTTLPVALREVRNLIRAGAVPTAVTRPVLPVMSSPS
jgi:glutamate dehydrogenase